MQTKVNRLKAWWEEINKAIHVALYDAIQTNTILKVIDGKISYSGKRHRILLNVGSQTMEETVWQLKRQ